LNPVQAIIMAPGNTYRRRRLELHPERPLEIRSIADGQSFLLHNNPIFLKLPPIECETIEDLISIAPPKPPLVPEHHMVLGEEDNAFLLVGVNDNPSFDNIKVALQADRTNKWMDAKSRASRDHLGTISDKVLMVTAGGALVLMVLIALVVLSEILGGGSGDAVEVVSAVAG
jgi:hypothetical protein